MISSRTKAAPTLHIEWSPTWVQAVDLNTSRAASGTKLTDLGPLLDGHRHALVGVARGSVFLKTVSLPRAAPEDLRRILGVQMGQFFPLPPDQLCFDFLQTGTQLADGFLTLVAAVRADDLKQLKADLQQVGITPTRIIPVALGAPVVAARANLNDAVVLECAANGLALDVVKDGGIRFSRVAGGGGDPLVEAQRTMAAAGAENLPLIAAGGGVAAPGAIAGAGTALRLLHEAVTPFAFELAEDRVRDLAKRRATRTRLAALMTLSAMLLVGLVWADRSDAAAVVRRGEESWTRQLSRLRSIRTAETGKAGRLGAMQTSLQRAFQPAQPLSDVVTIVGDSLPSGAWLTGVSLERGKPLLIRGTARTAADVSRFVSALGGQPRFRDVKLVFANNSKIEETPVVQFNVTAVAVGNLPMPAPVKVTKKATPRAAASETKTQ